MRPFRRSLSSNLGPLLLRVALGAFFLWAGWSKVMVTSPYPPEAAAVLANLGVDRAERAAVGAGAPRAPGDADAPDGSLPDPSSAIDGARVILAQATPVPGRVYTAADFSGPVEMANLHNLTLLLHAKASSDKPIWPKVLGESPWVVRMAYAAAWTELLAGAFVLIGLFTPLSAFAIACVMCAAMWLTQIGPATLGGGPSTLGFLPPLNNFSGGDDGWKTFLLQLALLCVGLSLMFSGGGALSVDRWIFGRPGGSSRRGQASYNSEDADGEDEDEE
ncbi:MAG: DoxX family protein [Phycisphaerales bacterium]